MKLYGFGTVVMIAMALVASTALGQEREEQVVSGTRHAKAIVRITSDRAVLPISEDVIARLLTSTPVSGELARELLGSEASEYKDHGVSFEPLSSSTSRDGITLVGRVSVEIYDPARPVAHEFLSEMCRRLQTALVQLGKADAERMAARLREVEGELETIEKQFVSIRALQQKLCEQAGRSDLARERLEHAVREHEDQKTQLELQLAGAQAREAALTQQIAKIGRQVEQSVQKSEVAAELRKVVEIHERALKSMKARAEQGLVSRQELDQAEESMALARAELVKYCDAAAQASGGGLLADLNKELVQLSIESAQTEARLRGIVERLEEIRARGLLELADRYEREVHMQLEFAERALEELMAEQYDLRRQMRSLRYPEVTVIGGE